MAVRQSKYAEYPVKPLKRTRLPLSTVVIATSTLLDWEKPHYRERWRTGIAHYRRTGGRRKPEVKWQSYAEPSNLWASLTTWCGSSGLTFVWVHDLPRLARISELFVHLPHHGWRLDKFSLNPGAAWMVWRKGKATIKVCDVMSIWSMNLDKLAILFGTARGVQPPEEDYYLKWTAYTKADATIIRTAVDAYMSWIESEDLGTLAVTGNGQAWSAFRRRFMTDGILIHADKDAREAERRAMWTGRCEAFWHGTIDFAVTHEWDLTSAYTNIVREHDLPTLLTGHIGPEATLARYMGTLTHILLAEVDVETSVPVVPCVRDGGIVWPVGRFTTTLWEPEIRSALGSGATVRLRRGWLYRRAPALGKWAEWVIAGLDDGDPGNPAWRRAILKRWGNVLIGHFAMQYPQWKPVAWSPDYDVHCTPMHEVESGESKMLMQVGHDIWEQSGMVDCHYSAPAITGYVMSLARVRLWNLMQAIPWEALLYVDTDSLLVTDRWLGLMTEIQGMEVGRGLRLKRAWDGLSIYGPRQVVTGGEARIAGLPKGARRIGRHDFEGDVVEGLLEAIGGGHLSEVHLTPRQWRIEGTDTRRDGPATGWTSPFTVDQVETG